ncbi:conserved hypothetical protein [metagenome]
MFNLSIIFMAESDIISFAFWALLTLGIMGVTGLSYRSYNRKRKNELSPS